MPVARKLTDKHLMYRHPTPTGANGFEASQLKKGHLSPFRSCFHWAERLPSGASYLSPETLSLEKIISAELSSQTQPIRLTVIFFRTSGLRCQAVKLSKMHNLTNKRWSETGYHHDVMNTIPNEGLSTAHRTSFSDYFSALNSRNL